MTDESQRYAVGNSGPVIETNDELDAIVLDADAQAERMSFEPYTMTPAGLLYNDDTIAGPFEILGRARDPNGDDWARWIRFKDADGRHHQVAIGDADLHGDPRTLAATLARQGLWISPKHRPRLINYFNNLQVDERVTFVPRTGWHNVGNRRVFVLPDTSFGASELVLLNTDTASPYGYKGTLTDWQNGIARLTAGQRLSVLAVSTAFAGPLLHLSGQDGGGIHIRGSSSTGKTSLARAAASVWGSRAYMRSWRATANGLEGAAVLATDTLLVLDELGVIDSRELNAAVYQLAIGHGKGRARRDGSMRTPASWRVMVVSTGEVSIASKVEEDRNRRARAGQEVRILDIQADAGRGYGAFDSPRTGEDSAAGLADEIVRSAEEFYGTAGPVFLQAIIDFGTDKTIEFINTAIETFWANSGKFGTDGQIRRAARRLALIAAAGELAHDLGIVPQWQKGEATKAAEFALEQWITGRGGVNPLKSSRPSDRFDCSLRSMATRASRARNIPRAKSPIVLAGVGVKAKVRYGWSCRRCGSPRSVPGSTRPWSPGLSTSGGCWNAQSASAAIRSNSGSPASTALTGPTRSRPASSQVLITTPLEVLEVSEVPANRALLTISRNRKTAAISTPFQHFRHFQQKTTQRAVASPTRMTGHSTPRLRT
jgi:Domain of unknown function (DUF927)